MHFLPVVPESSNRIEEKKSYQVALRLSPAGRLAGGVFGQGLDLLPEPLSEPLSELSELVDGGVG